MLPETSAGGVRGAFPQSAYEILNQCRIGRAFVRRAANNPGILHGFEFGVSPIERRQLAVSEDLIG